jgi:hypothetical protein
MRQSRRRPIMARFEHDLALMGDRLENNRFIHLPFPAIA